MRATGFRQRPPAQSESFLKPVRDFLKVDLMMTQFVTRHLGPQVQKVFCAPILALLFLLELLD